MNKTLRPATLADSRIAMESAQAALEGTDGVILVVIVARNGEHGPEVFAPCRDPRQYDRDLLKSIVAGVAKALNESGDTIGNLRTTEISMPPSAPRKGTVN